MTATMEHVDEKTMRSKLDKCIFALADHVLKNGWPGGIPVRENEVQALTNIKEHESAIYFASGSGAASLS